LTAQSLPRCIPLRVGRDFGPEDDAPGAQPHVIVDRRLADQLWPGRSPIGEHVRFVPTGSATASADVIGVVDHVQTTDMRQKSLPQIYTVAALLALVALIATALPAIRAVRVDPMLALRSE
jgi:hypothetical protein